MTKFFLLPITAFALQVPSTPKPPPQIVPTTNAGCSPITISNPGTINIHCTDLEPEVAEKLKKLVDQLSAASKKKDGSSKQILDGINEILARLDELHRDVAKLGPRHFENNDMAVLLPFKGQTVIIGGTFRDQESIRYANEIATALSNGGLVTKPGGISQDVAEYYHYYEKGKILISGHVEHSDAITALETYLSKETPVKTQVIRGYSAEQLDDLRKRGKGTTADPDIITIIVFSNQ